MKNLMKNETAKRYLLFIVSLFFSGVGIAFSKQAGLGISPISTASYVLSIRFAEISFGIFLFVWNTMMVFIQVSILRKNFPKIQWLQIPLSLLFGVFTDLGGIIAGKFPVSTYPFKLMALVIGTVILAFGIALAVIANVIMNSGEALIKVISDTGGFNFGYTKIIFDIANVAIAGVISLALLGNIIGIREGTIISAVFTGILVNKFVDAIRADVEKWLTGDGENGQKPEDKS